MNFPSKWHATYYIYRLGHMPLGYQKSQCSTTEIKMDKGIENCTGGYSSTWVQEAKHLESGKSECTCKTYADFKDKKSMYYISMIVLH